MPRLNVALSTEFRQIGSTNGFELYRQVVRKLDPPKSDNTFHLANQLRGLGGTSACKDFPQTVRFLRFFEGKLKEYLRETGQVFPPDDSARVLSQAIDEDTMGRLEDARVPIENNYAGVKQWIFERETKLKARKATRSHTGAGKGSDDMVYGVDLKQSGPESATGGVDPWTVDGSSDPWTNAATQPRAEDPQWPALGGELDAFRQEKERARKAKDHRSNVGDAWAGVTPKACAPPPRRARAAKRTKVRLLQRKGAHGQRLHEQGWR